MEEVFESENEVVVPKVKKPRKKRVVSEATKTRLRAQLKKGRETARLNRLKKKNAKGIKSKPKLVESKKVEDTPAEPTIKKKIIEKVAVVEKSIEKPIEKVADKPKPEPPPPKIIEEPRVVNKPLERSEPIPIPVKEPIPEPLPYQSTFKKARRKW